MIEEQLRKFYIQHISPQFFVQHTSHLWFLSEEKTTELLAVIPEERIPLQQKRFILKKAVEELWNLEARDVVCYLNGKLIIKKYHELSHETEERRFEGIPAYEIEQIVIEQFGKDLTIYAKTILSNAITQELNFTRITPHFFSKNFIPILQEKFTYLVSDKLKEEHNPLIIKGVANFILRQSFDILLGGFSDTLLELLVTHDKNADRFIRYYSGDVVTDTNGKHIQLPEVIDEFGNKWNPTSMMPILLQRKNGIIAIERQQMVIDKVHSDSELRKKRIVEILSQIESCNLKREEYETTHREIITQIDANERILKNKISPSNRIEVNSHLRNALKTDTQLTLKEKMLTGEIGQLEKRIEIIEKEKELFERKKADEIRKKESLIRAFLPIQEKYTIIAKALSKTLATR